MFASTQIPDSKVTPSSWQTPKGRASVSAHPAAPACPSPAHRVAPRGRMGALGRSESPTRGPRGPHKWQRCAEEWPFLLFKKETVRAEAGKLPGLRRRTERRLVSLAQTATRGQQELGQTGERVRGGSVLGATGWCP